MEGIGLGSSLLDLRESVTITEATNGDCTLSGALGRTGAVLLTLDELVGVEKDCIPLATLEIGVGLLMLALELAICVKAMEVDCTASVEEVELVLSRTDLGLWRRGELDFLRDFEGLFTCSKLSTISSA